MAEDPSPGSTGTDTDAPDADQLFKSCAELLLGAIDMIVIACHEGKLLTGDYLVGDRIQVDLD